MNTRDYYERYWSAEGSHTVGGATPALMRLFERWIPAGARCLDVGCGDGRTAGLWLVNHRCSYEDVDVSASGVEEAQALGLQAQRIDDARRLPFEDGSFDVVICIEVLEHLFAPMDTVREMARVLRPGGILIVTVPNVAYWRRRIDMALLGRWNPLGDDRAAAEPWRDPHIRFFNPGSMRRMIAAAQLSPVVIGAHAGGLLRDIPWISRRFHRGEASRLYRSLERVLPSLFGAGVYAVARRDINS